MVSAFGDCDALSFIGPAVDQGTADSDCEAWSDPRECDADCVDDNTPESIHGSACNEFYYTMQGLNTCESQGYGNFNGQGWGYYTLLTCTCFWDFPE